MTLCGHLYCWPCLYRWLRVHSHSPECPVCKAVIQEEKLVPLYGRGKTPSDPRTRSVPGDEIPHRPTGQRPETASPQPSSHHPPPHAHPFPPQPGFGFMGGGFPPLATARWGNLTFSAGIGGLFPSLFNFHLHGFPDAYGGGAAAAPGFPYGISNSFPGGHVHGFHHPHPPHQRAGPVQQADSHLTTMLVIVLVCVFLALVYL